ncbi:PREDICTED: uncharacterized protein LOC109153863 [Ipomoea nil]|uniref:uncharacterized protein LOC109153863 n=1 Tax=Ipomoea nil TaxID=35883 RepID=UPI0009014618|nr:PREDICTED: uncharacterized protein LOC109153863 [Ipomoea nil]
MIRIGRQLPPAIREAVLFVLREFSDIFAWGPEDMPGVDRAVICHRLAVSPTARPVKQKTRHLSNDRREFVKSEVKTLTEIGHLRPVVYPDWVANVVLVPKPPTWRMCIDYTDLNKACPLDPYPLPSIHQMVDDTAGADLMSFMDAFTGYHQILMAEEDEAKMSFVTPDGLFCYRVMPFGLRNAGATYQRMINALFEGQLGRTMEAYVDDMLVKSKDRTDHARDLRACFEVMRTYRLRLNPAKCTFVVQTGKFLGFMMTKKGIEPNPAKVNAILDMQPPTTIREVQQLTGRLAALNRFLSKLAEKALPFFKTLRKVNGFVWDEECQAAFKELKEYLMSPIVLSKPEPGEDLDLYLAASDRAVSDALCRTNFDGVQRPVYYVSHALQGPELRYSRLQKMVLALYTTSKKLTPYFQGRVIRVLTDQPIGAVLRTASSSGRLVKWAMMLTQFAIEYKPRSAIKGQALADFVVECTAREAPTADQQVQDVSWWEVATDGSSSRKGSGGGVVITSPEGFKVYYALIYQFSPTNNEAEYEAFVAGLQFARDLGAESVRARTDSSLVVGQVLGDFEVNGERLGRYRDLAIERLTAFRTYAVQHVPRLDNADADILSKLSVEAPEHISQVARVLVVQYPSIDHRQVLPIQPVEENWITDIMRYLEDGRLPDDEARARKAKLRVPRFQIQEGQLYRRSYGGPLMRCLSGFEAKLVMDEFHAGICSSHQGGRSLARRIMLIGYYWPSIQLDCEKLTKECETCQIFARMPGRPATFYHPVSTAIPFARWGVDIVGPFPQLSGRRKFIIVAIDYFSKWVEAEPLATITSQQCARFIWRNLVSRFGVPVQIVTDNGRQFEGQHFKNFLATIDTKSIRSSVAYPQGNGQVENANRTILEGLNKKLHSAGRSWANELPFVLWTYRTTPREATGETPFTLVYGAEARLPVEAWIASPRESGYVEGENDAARSLDLDCIEERRDLAARRIADYQKRIKAARDVRVRPHYFQVRDYVLRRREASQPQEGGKLAQNWEGLYVVSAVIRPGTYKLETTTGRQVDRTWNSENLVMFHQ